MNTKDINNKFQALYEKIIDIILWAEGQDHISEDGATILIRNINEAKEDIENE